MTNWAFLLPFFSVAQPQRLFGSANVAFFLCGPTSTTFWIGKRCLFSLWPNLNDFLDRQTLPFFSVAQPQRLFGSANVAFFLCGPTSTTFWIGKRCLFSLWPNLNDFLDRQTLPFF